MPTLASVTPDGAAVGRLDPARATLSDGVVRIGVPNEVPGASRASTGPGRVPAARRTRRGHGRGGCNTAPASCARAGARATVSAAPSVP